MTRARELWKRIESIHAVTYFAPESIAGAKAAGLKGFWMGYFGFRAAPLGAVSAGTVQASFANFSPSMVKRAIPDAWSYADPTELVDARVEAASAALRRLHPALRELVEADGAGRQWMTRLTQVAEAGDPIARPLFAANADLDAREDPVEQLWQLCTTLREHRGDGHVATLAAESIGGCEAHRLHAAANGTEARILRDNRGYSNDDWHEAGVRLVERGLMTPDDALTADGEQLVHTIEARTDQLAAVPFDRVLSDAEQRALLVWLDSVARPIAESGVLPFPNPMGLPPLGDNPGPQASR